MSESKELRGAIFRNKRKEKDTHPDRTGQCKIAGVEYWVSGWNEGEGDRAYISLKFEPKKKPEKPAETKSANPLYDD